MNNSQCPVNFTTVNQTAVRLVAGFVFLSSLVYLLFPNWAVPALLAVDFFLRGFGLGRWSLFGRIAAAVADILSLPAKTVDGGAKAFSAQLGFALADCLFLVSFFGLHTAGAVIAGVLLCFSFLEAAFGLCVGCWLYGLLKKPGLPAGDFAG